jgi:hypothetical protein
LQNPLRQIVGHINEALTHRTVLFLTATEKVTGISPEVSFKTMTHVYLGDLAARASIDFLADQIAGMGFYTTQNEDYIEQSGGKTAKEIIDDFCMKHGLDEVLQESARYLVGWGNVFWWVGNAKKIEFLKIVPLEIIKDNGIKFTEEGQLERIELDWKREPTRIPGDELIHLAYNVLTAKPLGIGILQSLCTSLDIGDGETREPFYQIKGKIQSGMAETINNFGAPNELWSFPGLSKEKLQEYLAQIKTIPRRGARFVFNPPAGSEARIQTVVAERMRGLDFYVENLEDEFVLGLQTPFAKLVTKTGFTEASANAALAVTERRVLALQRFLKRGVERNLFDRVGAEAGLDPEKAQVRLNWGLKEEPKFVTADMLKAFELGALSREEVRKMLMKFGWYIQTLPNEEESKPLQLLEDKVFARE